MSATNLRTPRIVCDHDGIQCGRHGFSIGVGKGDERRVLGVDRNRREVLLGGGPEGTVRWKPGEIAGRRGGSEVYQVERIELRAGDRIRWTRNDKALGLVNSRTAEVVGVEDGRVRSGWRTGARWNSSGAIRNCATSTTPGPTRSRAAPWTT